MRILGIDPGLTHTGWAVIEAPSPNTLSYSMSGHITSTSNHPIGLRLANIYNKLSSVITEYMPDAVALEDIFVNKNSSSSLKLGYARGISLMIPYIHNKEVIEYSATSVKKNVTGNGHASKNQVASMVKFLLPRANFTQADEIDATAVAICHIYHTQGYKRLIK